MISKPKEKCPPRDRNLLAAGIALGLGGGVALYAGVSHVQDARAQPSHTAAAEVDVAPTPDVPTTETAAIAVPQPVEAGSGSAAAPAPSAPAATKLELAAEPTLEQRLAEAFKLLEAYRAATDGAAKRLGLFALIAGIGWLLIAVLKAATPLGGDKWKKRIPVIVLGLGVAVALFAGLAAGQSWPIAAFYGAGPPLATFVQELIKAFKG